MFRYVLIAGAVAVMLVAVGTINGDNAAAPAGSPAAGATAPPPTALLAGASLEMQGIVGYRIYSKETVQSVLQSKLLDEDLRGALREDPNVLRKYVSVRVLDPRASGLIAIEANGLKRPQAEEVVNLLASALVAKCEADAQAKRADDMRALRAAMEDQTREVVDMTKTILAAMPRDFVPGELEAHLTEMNRRILELQLAKADAESAMEWLKKGSTPSQVVAAQESDAALGTLRQEKARLSAVTDPKEKEKAQARIAEIDGGIKQREADVAQSVMKVLRAQRQEQLDTVTATLLELTSQYEATKAGRRGVDATMAKVEMLKAQRQVAQARVEKLRDRLVEIQANPPERALRVCHLAGS